MPSSLPNLDDGQTPRAIFVSYAREDTPAAQRIAEALRSQGVEVWFDQSELRGGDAWDQKIRRQIRECALFMPIVSERTQARGEGYFRLEWKLAVERTHLMAEGVPFLAPVVVDGTPESAAIVPAEFLRVQWIRLPGALPTPQFVAQIKRMLEVPRQAEVPALPTRATAGSRPSSKRLWTVGVLVAAIVVVAAAMLLLRHSSAEPATARTGTPTSAAESRSIAVLPFENMSQDKENAFFTDGVHEDVLTNLSFLRDLHVISRTSVMQYRGTTKSIKQIGQELGVAYVLEGSVRREGNKVRVTGQLIDARTDEHLWAKAYDRDLNDIFAIQEELARAIADALQAVLSPETKVLLARRPTENTAAYDAYLKARQINHTNFYESERPITALLEEAVRLDPKFAAAWAALAFHRAFAYFNYEHTPAQLGRAKEAMDTAVRLAPDDPEVIEGLGHYYYYGFRDYPRATEQYLRLVQIRPNDPVMYYYLGLIQRRQGRPADALPNLLRGLKLDPTNGVYVEDCVETLTAVRRYDEAESLIRQKVAEFPQHLELGRDLAQATFFARGSTVEMQALAHRSVEPAERSRHLYVQILNSQICGDWAEFARLDREQRYYDGDDQSPHWSQDVAAAESFAEAGDLPAARSRAAEALALMQAELARQTENAQLWANLSLAQALLGHKDEALSSAKKSAELLPESRDAIFGPNYSVICAQALAWIGEKDRALNEFSRLLHVPWGTNIYSGRVSWRPLQDDPRFKALLADPANNAPMF